MATPTRRRALLPGAGQTAPARMACRKKSLVHVWSGYSCRLPVVQSRHKYWALPLVPASPLLCWLRMYKANPGPLAPGSAEMFRNCPERGIADHSEARPPFQVSNMSLWREGTPLQWKQHLDAYERTVKSQKKTDGRTPRKTKFGCFSKLDSFWRNDLR